MITLEKKRVTIMGLGMHGGGIASARYCAEQGAAVTVTDLQSAEKLADSVNQLKDLPITFVLGEHRAEDFSTADLVIKNPAVPRSNYYVQLAKRVETDITLFFHVYRGPVIAVTGSKGKSTTSSAIYHVLKQTCPGARLGGNITTSPLSFLSDVSDEDPVVLELSSFQLGDLQLTGSWQAGWRLTPDIAILTNIMRDHMDYYPGMEEYIRDKELICAYQKPDSFTILPADDAVCTRFTRVSPGRVFTFTGRATNEAAIGGYWNDDGGYLNLTMKSEYVVTDNSAYKGPKINLLTAALALRLYGIPAAQIRQGLSSFTGIPHRMETAACWKHITFVNDTAATIPAAVLASVLSTEKPLVLIAGGADKKLDIQPFIEIYEQCTDVILLAGEASERIAMMFDEHNLQYYGLFSSLATAVECATALAEGYTGSATVLLSPGAASFNMFRNEFDRGVQFTQIARSLLSTD